MEIKNLTPSQQIIVTEMKKVGKALQSHSIKMSNIKIDPKNASKVIYTFIKDNCSEVCDVYYNKKKQFTFVVHKDSNLHIKDRVQELFERRNEASRDELELQQKLLELQHYYTVIKKYRTAKLDFSEFRDRLCDCSDNESDKEFCNNNVEDFNKLEDIYKKIIVNLNR